MAETFREWQAIVIDPKLSRRLFTQVEITRAGMTMSGTFFGNETEFRSQELSRRFLEYDSLHKKKNHVRFFNKVIHRRRGVIRVFNDWQALVRHWAGGPILSAFLGQPMHFYHKSLTVTYETPLSPNVIDDLFTYFGSAKMGTPFWFIIFDMTGGAVNDVPVDATAYPHRSVLYYLQAYAVQLGQVSELTKEFIRGIYRIIEKGTPNLNKGIYPGYVDPELHDAQRRYWGKNLERLEKIKLEVDPRDVFHNPQSVRPATISE